MSGLLLLILIFIGLPLLWRWLKPYFFRWSQRRMADAFMNAMGVPPHDRSRSGARQSRYSSSRRSGGQSTGRRGASSTRTRNSGPLIPKEYAVDVEYTEIRSYSSEQVIASDGSNVSYRVESQVSDAEIIEIRRDR